MKRNIAWFVLACFVVPAGAASPPDWDAIGPFRPRLAKGHYFLAEPDADGTKLQLGLFEVLDPVARRKAVLVKEEISAGVRDPVRGYRIPASFAPYLQPPVGARIHAWNGKAWVQDQVMAWVLSYSEFDESEILSTLGENGVIDEHFLLPLEADQKVEVLEKSVPDYLSELSLRELLRMRKGVPEQAMVLGQRGGWNGEAKRPVQRFHAESVDWRCLAYGVHLVALRGPDREDGPGSSHELFIIRHGSVVSLGAWLIGEWVIKSGSQFQAKVFDCFPSTDDCDAAWLRGELFGALRLIPAE